VDRDFWIDRWQRNEIGFHQSTVHAALERWWGTLGVPRDAGVLVPLAGKSLDMAWLRAQGHRVVGVELSEIAVRDFFASQQLQPQVTPVPASTQAPAPGGAGASSLARWSAGGYELLCGDFFAMDAAITGEFAAVYDRAALIALPPDLRRRYAAKLRELCRPGTRMLLETLEYDQACRKGPPFAVPADEVQALHGEGWTIELLDRAEPADAARFKTHDSKGSGVPWINEASWRLERRR